MKNAKVTARFVVALHRDQGGALSIISVFTVLLLVMVLGMVMNVGRQVDGKIRMQNAADAATYSGGVVLARGMNALAFTNHLLCEVFAMTAWLREARDGNAVQYTDRILNTWETTGKLLEKAPLPKFAELGRAIQGKVPLERNLIQAFSIWAGATSEVLLPMMEEILRQELIPTYQRTVVRVFPEMAQMAARQIAERHGRPEFGRGPMAAALWRAKVIPVGASEGTLDRTLPVVDPSTDSTGRDAHYVAQARQQRERRARHYLRLWNAETLGMFHGRPQPGAAIMRAKMSQFFGLWEGFTCGQLERLLNEEFPTSNLLHVIREEYDEVADQTAHLRENFSFVGVAYWRPLREFAPRWLTTPLFQNPIPADAAAFAEARLFIPQARLHWWRPGRGGGSSPSPIGGAPGNLQFLPGEVDSGGGGGGGGGAGPWRVVRQGVPQTWDLMTQNWTVQLVPTTAPSLAAVLRESPEMAGVSGGFRPPNLGLLDSNEIQRISPH